MASIQKFSPSATASTGGLYLPDGTSKEKFKASGGAIIKRSKIASKGLVFGLPDNLNHMEDLVILKGGEIDTTIVGKVTCWWVKQE